MESVDSFYQLAFFSAYNISPKDTSTQKFVAAPEPLELKKYP